jgi:UDP-N-acetylmuramoyl-L-alanyl-D-glutamate--2,6-diaminopimelate ligase
MQASLIKKYFPNIQEFQALPERITSVVRSSGDFKEDSIFVAIKGNSWDGHSFVEQCIGKASLVVVSDKNVAEICKRKKQNYLLVEDTRECFGKLCNLLEGEPSKPMYCVGITGTNGKTTTNYCVESVLNAMQFKTAIMGTIDHHLGNKKWETQLTSPGPEVFYRRLKEMKEAGATALGIEMSSHALDQKRNHELELDVAIFTNLSQDHLDYHKNMDEYFAAKQKILNEVLVKSPKKDKLFVFNKDDSFAQRFTVPEGIKSISIGFSESADIQIDLISQSFAGMKFSLQYKSEKVELVTSLVGEFNLYNITSALAIALHKSYKFSDLQSLVDRINGVPGRLEKISIGKPVHCFVDFAHTPDALKASLSFLAKIRDTQNTKPRIISVFGAGGDRDKEKRPMMAKAAEEFSDVIIITSDNPRTEEPEEILKQIASGFKKETKFQSMEKRKDAIHKALSIAEEGDVILIAGKGHEAYQEIAGVKHPFSDQECVRNFQE